MAAGYALHAWSTVETALTLLFSNISGMDSQRKALIVMGSIVNFDARLAVCTSMIEETPEIFGADLDLWKKLSEKIRKGYKSRHQIGHFTFVNFIEDGKETIVLSPLFSPSSHYTGTIVHLGVSEINVKRERFEALAEAVQWFSRKALCRTRSAETIVPEPPLILDLRALLADQSK